MCTRDHVYMSFHECMCVCMFVYVRMRVRVRACVRACVRLFYFSSHFCERFKLAERAILVTLHNSVDDSKLFEICHRKSESVLQHSVFF